MSRLILSLIVFLFAAVTQTMAQRTRTAAVSAVGTPDSGDNKFYYANRSEPPRAIQFGESAVTPASFVANIHQYFSIPVDFAFIESESNTDDLGMRHHLLQQYYKGLPLEGLAYRYHERNGFVTSANGKAVRDIELEMETSISEQTAFQLAVSHLHSKDSVFRAGKKMIVSKGFTYLPQSFAIAYQFDIDVSLIEQWRISIDARTGQVINNVSLVYSCIPEAKPTPVPPRPLPYITGTGISNYYGIRTIRTEQAGTGSRLIGQTVHGGKIATYDFANASALFLSFLFEFHKAYEISSINNTYNNPYHRPAVSVQWAAEQAYEYYYNKHNRNSFDNNGTVIKSYVHVDQNWNNAMWTHNLLAFGDGSNNNPLVELDVVSHELTHGVTQYEANLDYYYESGALNESFSDILAKAVEFNTFGDTATWQLAKRNQPGGLRDFSNPNLKGQPDTYKGKWWYTGGDDNGGVHYNSGVQNFWYYLLCNGGSGVNDLQMNYSVHAIGMDAATKIAYRNLTEYLIKTSDYMDSRIGSLLAARDLYGLNSTIYQEVAKAWDAVGVIDEPIITSVEIFDITGTTAKFKGTLEPRGDNVTYNIEYGTTPALGSSSPVFNYSGTVEGKLTGLQSQTKYYFRLVATNENGSSFFSGEPFTTISLAPLVKIKQTVDVTGTNAILYGRVNPNSLSTSFYFEYGQTPAMGQVTPSYPVSDATEFQNVSAPVINLEPRKNYYYRLVATNSFASTTSESAEFFTAVKPVITFFTPGSGSIDTEITISGQNFDPSVDMNQVSFGATRATIVSASTTQLKVKVPAGASLGAITVLDVQSGLATKSVQEFVPVFAGGFKKIDLQLRIGISDVGIFTPLVEDIDGDGRPDIVGSHSQGFSVYMNVNQGGDITSQSFIRNTYSVANFSTVDFYLVDFDGNGLKDVVGRYQDGIRIFPNLSVPGFTFFGAPVTLSLGSLQNLTFEDFDQDGRVDIAGTKSIPGDSSLFTIFRNQNPRSFFSSDNFPLYYTKRIPYNPQYMTTGDLNNDGAPDCMAGPNYRNFMGVLINNSQPGVFAFESVTVPDQTRGDRFVRYFASDFNQDGWKDIIAHSPVLSANVAVMKNNSTSSVLVFEPAASVTGGYEASGHTADLNGDGKVDLIMSLNNRTFVFFQNKAGANQSLSSSSFEKFGEYGMALQNSGSGDVTTRASINDLNGDGRPDVVRAHSYNFGPHDGYSMEIWQNAAPDCPDPSLVKFEVSDRELTIVPPPNTTFEQFEIDYTTASSNTWYRIYSRAINLAAGTAYKVRVRAVCYLGFTDYDYTNITTDCAYINFTITNITSNSVALSGYGLGAVEFQYSPAGKGQWLTLPQTATQITNLQPGTAYDLRYRGRCATPVAFRYTQFTTLCPKILSLTVTTLSATRATVKGVASNDSYTYVEYGTDNNIWTAADAGGTLYPLVPGTKYFVRGRSACTDINADFMYTSFTTPCPQVSLITFDAVSPFSARVKWTDESNTAAYTVRYPNSSAGTETTETTANFLDLAGLAPGTNYTVSVTPQCIDAKSKNTLARSFNTVCYTPLNLEVNAITRTTADLSWTDTFGALPYSVDYSIAGSNVWITAGTGFTGLALKELRPGTHYEARVHIDCSRETIQYASIAFETGLYGETNYSPNPTSGSVTIYPSKKLIGNNFSLYDNAGRVLAGGVLRQYMIDLSDFSPGIYTLKIDGEKPMRIVKQ